MENICLQSKSCLNPTASKFKKVQFYFEGKPSLFPVWVVLFIKAYENSKTLFASPSLVFKLRIQELGNARFPLTTCGYQMVKC